jgi:hypothetical protein
MILSIKVDDRTSSIASKRRIAMVVWKSNVGAPQKMETTSMKSLTAARRGEDGSQMR